MKIVGATGSGGLWALKWAWHIAETNLRCVRSSGICMQNLNSLALKVSEISAFIRADRQTDMARSTRLVILIIFFCYMFSDECSIPFYSTSNGYNKKEGGKEGRRAIPPIIKEDKAYKSKDRKK